MLAGCSCCDRNRKWVAAHGLAWDRVYGLLLHREGWFMAFKELRRRFFCGGGAPQPDCPPACLPRAGVLAAIHCSKSLRAPFPSPWKGLHRTRERAGERGGARRCLPREAGAAAGGGGGGGRARGRGGGERPSVPPSRPRDSPAGPAKDARAVLPAPSPPSAFPRRPVIALERFPSGAHPPVGELASLASPVPVTLF